MADLYFNRKKGLERATGDKYSLKLLVKRIPPHLTPYPLVSSSHWPLQETGKHIFLWIFLRFSFRGEQISQKQRGILGYFWCAGMSLLPVGFLHQPGSAPGAVSYNTRKLFHASHSSNISGAPTTCQAQF